MKANYNLIYMHICCHSVSFQLPFEREILSGKNCCLGKSHKHMIQPFVLKVLMSSFLKIPILKVFSPKR